MKSYIFRIALLAFAIYLVANCIKLQVDLTNEKKQLAAQEKTNKEIQIEIDRLQGLIENGEDKDYIEDAARERLGYVFPDEEVYKSITGK